MVNSKGIRQKQVQNSEISGHTRKETLKDKAGKLGIIDKTN